MGCNDYAKLAGCMRAPGEKATAACPHIQKRTATACVHTQKTCGRVCARPEKNQPAMGDPGRKPHIMVPPAFGDRTQESDHDVVNYGAFLY